MEKTINFGLNKPSPNDFYNIEDFNENAVIIDETLKSQEEAIKSTNRNIEKVDATVKMHDDSIKALEEKCENEIVTTDTTTLRNSKAGGIRVIGIDGNSIQNGEPTTDNQQEIVSFGECVEMMRGIHSSYNNGVYEDGYNAVTCVHKTPCKEGDNIVLQLERAYEVSFQYFSNTTFLSASGTISNIDKAEVTVPTGATFFTFNIGNDTPITPQTVGKITLTVNGKYVIPVTTRGKNKLENRLKNGTIGGITLTRLEDGWYSIEGTATGEVSFRIDQSTQSGIDNLKSYNGDFKLFSEWDGTMNGVVCCIMQNNTWSTPLGASLDNPIQSANINHDNCFVVILLSKGSTVSGKVRLMICDGTVTDPTFKPYTEHTEYIYLNEPPRSIDDVKDMIVEKDGLFGVERCLKVITCDGSPDEGWALWDTNTSGKYRAYLEVVKDAKRNSSDNSKDNVLCTAYRVATANETYFNKNGICLDKWGKIFIYDENHNTSSLTSWNKYLQSSPIEIMYALATPTFEPLDTESQKALRRLLAHDDVTYIDFDSTIPPSKIEVEYGTSKVGALSLENANLRELLSLGVKDEVNTIHETLKTFNSTLNSIGNEYYSDELLTTSIKAGEILDIVTIDTVTEDVPKGKYMVYVQISGYSGTQGSGEIRLFAGTSDIKGCYSVPFQNVGTDLRFNAYISCIVEIKVRYDPVTVKMDTTTDQRITGGHILLVKIA